MIWIKACPRCRGDLVPDSDRYGCYVSCIQCGGILSDWQERALAALPPSGPARGVALNRTSLGVQRDGRKESRHSGGVVRRLPLRFQDLVDYALMSDGELRDGGRKLRRTSASS